MAQIVTITNPLTGQPVQVDQLEHTAQQIDDAIARALPGGGIDTLLAGKAPAGYGIGENYPHRVNNTDLDTLNKGGTYSIGTGCTNTPPNTDTAWSTLHVIPGRACTQIYIPANDANRAGTFSSWIARIYNDKTAAWGEWEWVNPPMALGVEYRTTERYQRKPVYYKLVNFGALPNSTTARVAHGVENIGYRIFVGGDANGEPLVTRSGISYVTVGPSDIVIATSSNLSAITAYVLLKYTKSTD